MSTFRLFLLTLLLALSLPNLQACQFMAGAAVGAGATEVAEEIEDDDDGDD